MTQEAARQASAEERLKELGITLPVTPEPFGIYAEAVQTGTLLSHNGMLPTQGQNAKFIGRIGAGVGDRYVFDYRPVVRGAVGNGSANAASRAE